MAIIELNLEKPALKRVESVDEKRVEDERIETEDDREDAVETVEIADESEETDESSESSDGGSRLRAFGRRLVVLAGVAAGVAAARKFRQRRGSKSKQQELEEDWQTAE